ncbi:hypothetical protein H310_13477 [Aphanomyces invadans]|uniref:Uncharacterized protein n=1 Tax=Aphanomyces invadans TaxID=157072 RepID=A0A024TDL4_9STRA|nr:hypothetical protein H310_13477 [Aphanomyces invadans]ETV92250.1 hypothetical protein H310_13477 [Aphanomyces invadans]|eukprot:XP_008879214.1 hypothetical protein H310_13477 [Aphanomyces invadans]
MSLLEAPPPVAETALVVSRGSPPQEELPVDLMQLPSIPLQKSLLLLTNFCTNTVRFINHFSSLCEERLATTSKNLTRLEISLAILEAKLNSIPDLAISTTPADLPRDLNLPPTDAAPAPPPPPPPGPAPDATSISGSPPPPPPPPPSSSLDSPPPPPPSPPAAPEVSLLKLKDDPMYATYFTMQRLRMPMGAIRQKMLMDGLDPDILSMDPEGPSPSATSLVVSASDVPPSDEHSTALTLVPVAPEGSSQPPPPPPPPSTGLPPVLPVPDPRTDMPPPPPTTDPAVSPAAPPAAAPPTFVKLKDDPMFEKYFKMQKLGMPEAVIRHKLAMDGVTVDIFSMDPDGPSPNRDAAAADDDDF